MKMHNAPHSWPDLLELLQSWWRGDTPLGAVVMSIVMAGLRIAYFGGGGGWKVSVSSEPSGLFLPTPQK